MDDNPCNCGVVVQKRIVKFNRYEPRCYAPQVDVTHARQAYGRWALPKLVQDLCLSDRTVVRQAITSIADISVNPEEMPRIIELRIHERIADLLISEDPYLRERVAMIYGTMSSQTAGREAIFNCPIIVEYLSTGLLDKLSFVRTKMAQAIANLARNPIAADELCEHGLLEKLVQVIDSERNTTILALHLESLGCLLNNGKVNVNTRAIEINAMEKLVSLFNIKNKDEAVLAGTLSCLVRLCQEATGKQKSIEMDLLSTMKEFLNDQRYSVQKNAAAVIMFATITTTGKLRAVELEIIDSLVKLAADTNDRGLQLASIQALSNIAEVPSARMKLISEYATFIENIDTCMDEATSKYKNILMTIMYWSP